jgi:hypothetical protein
LKFYRTEDGAVYTGIQQAAHNIDYRERPLQMPPLAERMDAPFIPLIRAIRGLDPQGARPARTAEADLSGFFTGVKESSGSSWREAQVPLLVREKVYLFRYVTVGGETAAVAEGLEPVRLARRPAPAAAASNAAGDAALMAKSVTARVHSLLDAADISNARRVVLTVNADILPVSSFELYAAPLVEALRQAARRKYGRNVLFQAAGARAAWLEALDPDAKILSRSVPADWAGAGRVLLDVPGAFEGAGIRLPVKPLSEGDVPAYEAVIRLAIEGGRIDPAGIPDGFEEAFDLLSGTRPGKPVLAGILTGLEPLEVVERHALKALQAVPLSEIIRLFRLWKSQFEQSA